MATTSPIREASSRRNSDRTILIASIVDWAFMSHRVTMAKGFLDAGYKVHVMSVETDRAQQIRDLGFTFHPIEVSRKGTDPREEYRAVKTIEKVYRAVKPDLVLQSGIKLVIQGSFAARKMRDLAVVNLITGLGFGMSEEAGWKTRLIMNGTLKMALRRSGNLCVFQNPDAMEALTSKGYVMKENTFLVKGSGVNPDAFPFSEEPEGPLLVMLPSRMLLDKGIVEFVTAARKLKAVHPDVRFVLVGGSDEGNPVSVAESQIKEWVADGAVEWWGHQTGMAKVLSQANIVVLPSYHEGLPRVLIEAASVGRAIVATDIPGCREVAIRDYNALLCPKRDADGLADAMDKVIRDKALRRKFATNGRELVLKELSDKRVVEQMLEVIDRALAKKS